MNQSWSIIIFGYNEGETISSLIQNVNIFLNKNKLHECEIIYVDDGSNDRTEEIIKNLIEKNSRIKYIKHLKNLGIGPALLSGYNRAVNENVVAIPADGQFNIEELTNYINFPERSYVSFYRAEMKEYSILRKMITKANKLFNVYFLSLEINDVNWVKAFKSKDLKEINLKLTSSLVSSEICAKLNIKKYVAINALSVYHQRVAGKARGASIKTISQAFGDILKLFLIIREFKKNKKNYY